MTNYVYPTAVTNVSDDFQEHLARGSVNPGTDYTAGYGSQVVAVAAGTVTDADGSNGGGGGRTIHIDHDDGSGSDYLHMSVVGVGVGQHVGQGQALGQSGASGYGSDWYYGPHLHISFRYNHAHGYGNSGNVDFDQIMKNQGGAAPAPVIEMRDTEMRIIEGGTVALVGEYTGRVYTSPSGSQGFSWGSNAAAYGTSSGLTQDQVTTLVNEAADRRTQLVADITAQVLASQPVSAPQTTKSWGRVAGLFIVAIVLLAGSALVSTIFPDANHPAAIVLLAVGAAAAVLGGYSVPGAIRTAVSASWGNTSPPAPPASTDATTASAPILVTQRPGDASDPQQITEAPRHAGGK